jgi:hypothetical protein
VAVPLLQCWLTFLLCWALTSSLWFFPHNLSYFNELVGGPRNGSDYLLGSNVDWGQDLYYALSASTYRGSSPKVLTHSYLDPRDLGFSPIRLPLDPENVIHDLGWTAVSVNALHGDPWPVRGNGPQATRDLLSKKSLDGDALPLITYALRKLTDSPMANHSLPAR